MNNMEIQLGNKIVKIFALLEREYFMYLHSQLRDLQGWI